MYVVLFIMDGKETLCTYSWASTWNPVSEESRRCNRKCWCDYCTIDVDELTDEDDISEEIIGEASVQDIPGSFEVKMNQQPIENHAKDREGSAKSCRRKLKKIDNEPVWRYRNPEYSKVRERSEQYTEYL